VSLGVGVRSVASVGLAWVGLASLVSAVWLAVPASSFAQASSSTQVPPPPSARRTGPVEALVAVVGARTPSQGASVVLASDVELVAALALARGGVASATPTPALLQAALDQIIGEVLIRREALRLGASSPSPEQIAQQRDALERSIGGSAALEALLSRLHVDQDEIEVLAERRAVVEQFLGANLEGASAVTEADIEEAYLEAAHPFAGRPLDEVREALRVWLRMTLVDAYVARWLETLRGRTDVNVVRPFEGSEERRGREGTSDVGPR